MFDHAGALSRHPFVKHFRPAVATGFGAILPVLHAFGGLRVHSARPTLGAAPLGRLGTLEVRLAQTAIDVRRAQRLRYEVFYEEGAATPDAAAAFARRDVDPFDAICDHVLIVDRSVRGLSGAPKVVGTCRILRQNIAERHGGFYTAGEFDVGALLARHRGLSFAELGRACVLAPYRNKRTVELLWHGIWSYMLRHRVDAMIGCGSLDGTDPDALALPLSFLHHYAAAPDAWRGGALPERRVEMNRMPKDAIDPKSALRTLPPLIKGYLRLGAFVGDGAVVDRQFGTTDVLVMLPVSAINTRYLEHFGADAERHAA